MTLTETASDPYAIDAAWLTGALEGAGVAKGANVVDVSLVSFIGTGQMGRNARFSLTWDDPVGRPASIVGKFPTDDPTGRATGFEQGSYWKEWLFYTQLRPTVGARTPEVWVALYESSCESDRISLQMCREALGHWSDSSRGPVLARLRQPQPQ